MTVAKPNPDRVFDLDRLEERAVNGIVELDAEETRAYFDAVARRRLGISGEEFLRRRRGGEYDEIIDDPANHPDVVYVGALSRFGR